MIHYSHRENNPTAQERREEQMDLVMEGKIREMTRLMEEFVPSLVSFYRGIKDEKVCREADSETIARLRQRGIPREGRPVEEVFREMEKDVYGNLSLVQHPRSFACVPSPVSLFSWMGDVMTNGYDPHASCWTNASAANCVEQEVVKWMCSLAGYPETAGGLFVSGGSMANLTALTAARDDRLKPEEWGQGVAYVSDQTHSSVAKGLHIIGFRPDQIRKIPTHRDFRMDMEALEAAVREDLEAGRKPFAVIATAGTTNTGSVDPLPQIGELCRRYGLWMHVDGAYGASVLVSRRHRENLRGIELSDSLSWDAHKWLMQTYGCSAVLVRDQKTLIHAFSAHPEYLEDAGRGEEVSYWDLGPELTRPARSLKLWITLQILGADAMGEMIDHGFELARLAEETVRQYADWEIISPAQQAIVNFRYAPVGYSESQLDRINQQIAMTITQSGYAQVLTTQLDGKRVLRICALHPETTREDIQSTIRLLDRYARQTAGQKIA